MFDKQNKFAVILLNERKCNDSKVKKLVIMTILMLIFRINII